MLSRRAQILLVALLLSTSFGEDEEGFGTCADGGAAGADGSCDGAGSPSYQVLAKIEDPKLGTVRVVRTMPFRHEIDFLMSGAACIGARWLATEFHSQLVFNIFNIMGAVRWLQPKPQRVLMLGLGAGSAPTMLRNDGIRTDVVELHPGVVQAAAKYFDYDASGNASKERLDVNWGYTDLQPYAGGSTSIADARKFIFEEKPSRYDVIVHDLFVGLNPVMLHSQQVYTRLREHWLADQGVLLVNFLGYHAPATGSNADESQTAYPLSAALARTLRRVFPRVRCFTDHETNCPKPKKGKGTPGCSQGEPSNIICFCSAEPWTIKLPKFDAFINPAPDTVFWTIQNFQTWEVLRPESEEAAAAGKVIDEEVGGEQWLVANQIVTKHMKKIVKENLLPHDDLWEELETS